MSTPDLHRFLPALACAALAGRVLLACLPADAFGRRQLATTWFTSFYLGWGGLALEVSLAQRLGIDTAPWGLALPWLALALGRLATLPGGMAPRHAPREEALTWVSNLLAIGIAVWLVRLALESTTPTSPWLIAPMEVPPAVHVAAAATFTLHGLRLTRRSSVGRLLLALVLVCTPAIAQMAQGPGPDALTAALAVAGAAYSIAWLRRANKRALWLALISFAALPATGDSNGLPIGAAGLVALAIATPQASRRRVLPRAAAALAVSLLLQQSQAELQATYARPAALWCWWLLACGGAVFALRSSRAVPAMQRPEILPPRREHVYLLLQLGLGLLASAALNGASIAPLALLAPVAALAAGLVLPPERP